MEHSFAPPLAPPKAVVNRTFLRFGENKKSQFSLKIRILCCFAFLCCGATRKRTACPNDAFNRAEGASGNGFTKCVVQKKYLCF